MIALLAGLLISQTLAAEVPALIEQALDQVATPYGEMAYAVGLCAKTYPLGSADPFVVQAKRDVAELGLQQLNFSLARIEAISYAEGIEASKTSRTTVRGCASVISEAATDVSQNVNGLRGLMYQLAQ